MGLFKRKTTRRQEAEAEAEANPRSQAHPMPVEPPPAAPVEASPETRPRRDPVPVMATPTGPGDAPPLQTPFAAELPSPTALTVVPPRPTHAASTEEHPYDRLDCPACGTIFRDLPDARVDCPACGATVDVLTCPEGVRHMLTAADLASFDDDWDALHATRRREEAQRRNAAALEARRATLASYGALGVRLVELRTAPGACPACLAAAGHPYRPRAAPGLPIAGCEHDVCHCEYAPARPSATRR